MSYRFYLGSISKETHMRIKDMGVEELKKLYNIDHVFPAPILEKVVYELGSNVDKVNVDTIRFFSNVDMDEYDFCIVDKSFLKELINQYREKIQRIYNDLSLTLNRIYEYVESDNIHKYGNEKLYTDVYNILTHINSMRLEWNNRFKALPFKLDEGDEVVTSWKYEYAIFELVRIYKTFDYDNNHLIFCGW